MGVDYIINYNCPIKEELGFEETFNTIKTKAQFDFLRNMIGQPGYENLNMFSNIRFQILTNGEFREQNATMKEIDENLENYRQLIQNCEKCSANLANCAGGCWGYITYPVRPFVESFFIWAVEYLIDLELNKPSGMLIKYILEHDLKPEIIPNLRKEGMIELSKPLEYKWGKFIKKKKIDTNQVMEMLFGFQVDSGSAMVISSFLFRCREILPQWLDSFAKIVVEKNPELTLDDVRKEVTETLTPYFQYGEACFYAFNNKENLVVMP